MNTHEAELFDSELTEATYLWCYRRLSNTHDAEDLSQEILLEAILSYRRACDRGTPPVAFYPWYWGIAQNRLRLFYRSRKKQAVLLGETVGNLSDSEPYYLDLCDIDDAIIAEDERQRLTYQLSLLSRIQRECVVLYYLRQKSVKEIALMLDIPEGTVKSRLFDARKNVRKGMENSMENHSSETQNKRLSYAPASLNKMGCNMITNHWDFLNDMMVEQIIAVCAYEGKTVRQIAEAIGVAPVYFEDKLNYLLEHKFLKETVPGTYIDDFCVFPEQAFLDYSVAQNRVFIGRMGEVAATVKALLPTVRKYIANEAELSDGFISWFLYVLAAEGMENAMLRRYRKDYPHDVPESNGKDWRLLVRVHYPDDIPTQRGEYKGVSWSNIHKVFKTAHGAFTLANLFQFYPFEDRDDIVTESNADLLMRLYRDPRLALNEFEQEQAAHLISKGFLVARDNGLFLNLPVLAYNEVDEVVGIFEKALDGLCTALVADLVKVSDENLLSYVRPDLMEEYVNYVMSLSFFCVGELFWHAFNEGHDLEIPADYTTSAAAMALYIR